AALLQGVVVEALLVGGQAARLAAALVGVLDGGQQAVGIDDRAGDAVDILGLLVLVDAGQDRGQQRQVALAVVGVFGGAVFGVVGAAGHAVDVVLDRADGPTQQVVIGLGDQAARVGHLLDAPRVTALGGGGDRDRGHRAAGQQGTVAGHLVEALLPFAADEANGPRAAVGTRDHHVARSDLGEGLQGGLDRGGGGVVRDGSRRLAAHRVTESELKGAAGGSARERHPLDLVTLVAGDGDQRRVAGR